MKYTLEQGDLENGFYLNRSLEGTMMICHGRSMGAEVLYAVRIKGRDFEGCSFNDDAAKRKLRDNIVNEYQYLEKKTERLTPEEELLRRELSDLLRQNNE